MISDSTALVTDLLGRHPDDSPYLVGDTILTHGKLREAVSREAATLRAHDIGPDSSVAVQVPPSFTRVTLILALWSVGAQVMLLDHRLREPEVNRLLAV